MKASTVFAVIFGWCILSLAGHTMWKVMWFLSSFPAAPITQNSSINESHQSLWSLLMSLWFDACLVLLFIFQHRVLKTRDIENYLANHALPPVAARSIYVLLSSMALQIIVKFWTPTYSYNLWTLESGGALSWGVFTLIHLFAWAFVYGGSVLLDLPELLGIKQIYYYHLDIRETSDLKSSQLKRLYSHKRHPSYLGFIAILFITPVMSLDRILLAIFLTLYMTTAWEPTADDTRYHQQQLNQKTLQIDYTTRRRREVEHQMESRHYR